MTHEIKRGRTIAIRLNGHLNDALQRVADREANAPATVARRLIALGLEREAQTDDDARSYPAPEGDAA